MKTLILKILSISMFSVMLILFLLLITTRWLGKSNRLNMPLKSIVGNILEGIIIFIDNISIVLVKLSLYFLLIYLVPHEYKVSFFNHLNEYYKQNIEIGNLVVGAFLASLFGILTQRTLIKSTYRDEVKKHSTILYNDLQNIVQRLDLTQKLLKTSLISAVSDVWSSGFFESINYDSNWRSNYSYLTGCLSNSHYTRISEIYSLAELYNEAVKNKSISKLTTSISKSFLYDKIGLLIGDYILTNEELLGDLFRITENKPIKNARVGRLFKEILYLKEKEELFNYLEAEAIRILIREGKLKTTELIKQIVDALNTSKKRKFLKDTRYQERLIYEVLHESKKIKLVWDTCSLTEQNMKEDSDNYL